MPAQLRASDLAQAFESARAFDGSMNDRLNLYVDAVRRNHQGTAAIVDRLVARLRQHRAGDGAPKVGDEMPPFVLPDEAGRIVSLADLLAQGPAIVTFHRGHW